MAVGHDEVSGRAGPAQSWPPAADGEVGSADPAATIATLDWLSRQRAAMYPAGDRTAPGQARALARSVALSWPACAHIADDIELVASELVTNAVTHAAGPHLGPAGRAAGAVILSISFCPREGAGAVIVRVRDDCPMPPRIAQMQDLLSCPAWEALPGGDELDALILSLAEGGRGLRLVAERARLGWYRVGPERKVVWAEITASRPELALALAGAPGGGDAFACR